jgi:hypothetical protein
MKDRTKAIIEIDIDSILIRRPKQKQEILNKILDIKIRKKFPLRHTSRIVFGKLVIKGRYVEVTIFETILEILIKIKEILFEYGLQSFEMDVCRRGDIKVFKIYWVCSDS